MNSQHLTVSGPVTIYEAKDWRDQFLHSLRPGEPLEVDLHTSGPWDIAGLQLLISLANTADAKDCEIRFQLVPEVCRELAQRAGLSVWLKQRSVSEL